MSGLSVEAVVSRGVGPATFSVESGECICLTGPSGAGKTLLLRAIADLDEHSGRVLVDGTDSNRMPPPEWRQRVGLLPAESFWWSDRVGDHFVTPDEGLLAALGFELSVVDWSVSRCSTGERQRLAIARLLQNHPQVLLLDEPTAALDAANVARVEALVNDYRRRNDAAVVWVSHDAEQVRRLCHRVLLLESGKLREVAA